MARRLAAIMAGDIVGYSRLMANDEDGTYRSLRQLMAEIVEPAVAEGGGRIFKTTGDGFLATFGSVGEALDAGIAIQRGLDATPMRMRLGLNLGDVIEEAGDVFGDGVNIAARLEAMAEPGSIYVSGAVARAAGNKSGARFARVGRRRGKNLPQAIEVFALRPRSGGGWVRAVAGSSLTRGVAVAAAVAAFAGVGLVVYDGKPFVLLQQGLAALSGTPAEASAPPVVAVLPFDELGGDGTETYFTDGLAEDIINDLARSRELLVIARNSTFAYKDRSIDIRTIGEQLGADYIVEGSARRAGAQLRVTAQLIDADTGTHLWSKNYDRQMADVFAIQDELTAEIVASLVSYVQQTEEIAVASRPTESLRAYDLVLQGRDRYAHNVTDPRALLDARDLFARAVELDPGYAVARAQLGLTFIKDYLTDVTGMATREDLDGGFAHVREAIRLEPELALAYQVLSYGLAGAGDYEGAMRAAGRAVELNPSDPDSLMSLAKAETRFGSYAEAVEHAERARRLHPLAPQYYPYIHGQALYAAGRYEDAGRVLADCLLRIPDDRNCLRVEAVVLVRLGRLDEARATVQRLREVDPAFSLAAEREDRRFGGEPLMEAFLSDLAAAGAPETAEQA